VWIEIHAGFGNMLQDCGVVFLVLLFEMQISSSYFKGFALELGNKSDNH
jgi:hypothetical protein